MSTKNVRNLTAGHLSIDGWFFGPKGTEHDTVRGVDEAKIPADVVKLSKGPKALVAIENVGAKPAPAPVAPPPAPAPVTPTAPPPVVPLVVPDDGQ